MLRILVPASCFSAKELFDHQRISPALRDAFTDAGITSIRKLGKRLPQLGLVRVGEDEHGIIWAWPEGNAFPH